MLIYAGLVCPCRLTGFLDVTNHLCQIDMYRESSQAHDNILPSFMHSS